MNYRHGDLCLRAVDKLPDGLKASTSNVLMTGSGGNDHVVTGGIVYPVTGQTFVVGYLDAKSAKLLHPDHGVKVEGGGRIAAIEARVYELRRQIEDTHAGFKPVID